MVLMSDVGKHVGGKALDATTDVVVPSLPSAAGIRKGRKKPSKKVRPVDSKVSKIESSRKIEPNDLDVSVEHETSGKISKGTFADSESKPTTSGGGFFFPTLLASTSKGDAVPNVAPTKFNELF